MKNAEVLGNFEMLKQLDTTGLSGVRLSYALNKNIKTLALESDAIKNSLKYTEEFKKYKEEITELFKTFCIKDDSGKAKIIDGMYKLDLAKEEEFRKLETEKREQNKELIEENTKIEEEYNKFLEEESTIKLEKIELDDLPADITPTQMNLLSFMITEFD